MPYIPTADRLAGLSAKELKDELRAARTRRTKGVREGLDPAPLLDPEVWALETEQARRAGAGAEPGASAASSPLPPVGETAHQGTVGFNDKVAQLTASVLALSTACTANQTALLSLEGLNEDLTVELEDSRRETAVLRAEVDELREEVDELREELREAHRFGGPPPPPAKRLRFDEGTTGVVPAAQSIRDTRNPWALCDPTRWPPVLDGMFFVVVKGALERLYPYTSERMRAQRSVILRDIEKIAGYYSPDLPVEHFTIQNWLRNTRARFIQLEYLWRSSAEFRAAEDERSAGRGDIDLEMPPDIAEGRAQAYAALEVERPPRTARGRGRTRRARGRRSPDLLHGFPPVSVEVQITRPPARDVRTRRRVCRDVAVNGCARV